MFKKTCASLLFSSVAIAGMAQAEGSFAQHYFGLWGSNASSPQWKWLEVNIELNGISYTKTFQDSDQNLLYTFSLSEMDMSKQGAIQVTAVRYQERNTGNVYTIPFIDNADCAIQVSPKNGYPDSTITTLAVSNSGCAMAVRPYTGTSIE